MTQPKNHLFQIFILVVFVLCSMLVFTFLTMLISMPIFGISSFEEMLVRMDPGDPDNLNLLRFHQVFNHIGVFIIPSLLFILFFRFQPIQYLKLDRVPIITSILLVFLLLVSILPFLDFISIVNESVHFPGALSQIEEMLRQSEQKAFELTERFLAVSTNSELLFNIFMIALLPAIGEELIFRGILQRILIGWIKGSPVIAILITSLVFSALHMQFFSLLPRFLLGILLGYLFYWSGSLWLPVIAHFANNAMAVLVYYLATIHKLNIDPEQLGQLWGNWGIVASGILSVSLLVIIHVLEKKREIKSDFPLHPN